MARIKNELSWSRTRISTFETCPRAYYYQYYLKWGGWNWDAPDDSRQAYFFTKMTNIPMLVGLGVHETIRDMLRSVRDTGRCTIENPADHVRRNILSKVWRDAKKELWRKSAKNHPPVFELYYGSAPSPEELKRAGAHAARCIENFAKSELFQELQNEEDRRWLAVDEEPSFDESSKLKLDDRTIWALPDFAREKDGHCEIWDWKTGRRSPHDQAQLLSYALYARDRWGYAPDRIRLMAFDLADDEIGEYPCNAEELAAIETKIRDDFLRMEELLEDKENNIPLKDVERAFPMIENGPACENCFYKELCGRGRYAGPPASP